MSNPVTLRVLTTDPDLSDVVFTAPVEPLCSGAYTCICGGCTADRILAVKRGVRPSEPLPLKRAA